LNPPSPRQVFYKYIQNLQEIDWFQKEIILGEWQINEQLALSPPCWTNKRGATHAQNAESSSMKWKRSRTM